MPLLSLEMCPALWSLLNAIQKYVPQILAIGQFVVTTEALW
jgi:hypothetical protein